jgi:hypothetical protein
LEASEIEARILNQLLFLCAEIILKSWISAALMVDTPRSPNFVKQHELIQE